MIETLMHNRTTYKHYFETDRQRGRPSLPHMFATGIVLVDDGTASEIQLEAQHLLDAGPPEFNLRDVGFLRFVITNHLLDLEGGLSPLNAVFTVNDVANALQELVLRSHGRWIGKGKGIIRALGDYDQTFAKRFEQTFHGFYINHDVQEVVTFVDTVLEEYGGRLFEGYSSRQL
ncbi:nucleotidyltransferase domain-containing protein [Alicyclobacillus sp. ALC3]|uniref:nucleotidyltransferase domain-containing protein n=1 Tax=Alicyclobacillus sp. ALC3 TaxID=2796143 RepID=UPI002377EA89|nr:nucleotidyltransferase domain-containing protein [Alicyclobacillus sp. ALC3]WDL97178.1 nucleotidyltransferase domain-containing protein [Alicyclobacillus sp. ALC3]